MKKKRLTRGENFLPNVGIEKLKALRKKETNAKARDRLLIYIYRKEGKSIREIGKIFDQAYSTIRDWLVRADQAGLERLYDISPPGLSRKLSPEQIAEIRADRIAGPQKHGFESEMWTGRMMAEHVRRKYGIEHVPRTMQRLMHHVGFSYVKPRPKHPKSASNREKKAFKKKLDG